MKYRQIAALINHDLLAAHIISPEDGLRYGENKKEFTPKQLEKAQQALETIRERVRKRLKKQGVRFPK